MLKDLKISVLKLLVVLILQFSSRVLESISLLISTMFNGCWKIYTFHCLWSKTSRAHGCRMEGPEWGVSGLEGGREPLALEHVTDHLPSPWFPGATCPWLTPASLPSLTVWEAASLPKVNAMGGGRFSVSIVWWLSVVGLVASCLTAGSEAISGSRCFSVPGREGWRAGSGGRRSQLVCLHQVFQRQTFLFLFLLPTAGGMGLSSWRDFLWCAFYSFFWSKKIKEPSHTLKIRKVAI